MSIVVRSQKQEELTMPFAVATWLIENTTLTFEQIGDFCDIHELDVGTIGSSGVLPISPIGIYLTKEEIARCEKDSSAQLKRMPSITERLPIKKPKLRKYTPMLQKKARFDAILWLVTFHPNLKDNQIANLVHSTTKTVSAIRGGTYNGIEHLVPKSPVVLGLCTKKQLDELM